MLLFGVPSSLLSLYVTVV